MLKFLIIFLFGISLYANQSSLNSINCQNVKVLVLYTDFMCPDDLDTIAREGDIKVKRNLVKRYSNFNLATFEYLYNIEDLELKKRLYANTATPDFLKQKIKEKLNIED